MEKPSLTDLPDLNGDLSDSGIGEMVRMAPEARLLPFPQPSYEPAVAQPLPAPSLPQVGPNSPEREDLTQQRETLKTIRALLDGLCMVLAPRALLFIAMLAVFALFMVALFIGEVKLLVAAGVFGMIIFFPTAFLYMKG